MNLLERTVSKIGPQDAQARSQAKVRLEQLTMPYWALGTLMDMAVDLAGITRLSLHPVPAQNNRQTDTHKGVFM